MYIAVDGFGGDNAPVEICEGVALALNEKQGFNVYLTGDKDKLFSIVEGLDCDKSRIEIINAPQIITMEDHPATAMREKPESSMAVAFDLVNEGKASAVLSAGNTGAILSGGIFKLKRIKGIARPALAPFMPCFGEKTKSTLILDAGANADCKPEYLFQFAFMASEYLRVVFGNENPSVGLINIGVEEGKGNELTKQTYDLLKASNLNFIGNVEARDIVLTEADILVTDGFTGNVVIKFMEGMAKTLAGELKEVFMGSASAKMGALLAKNGLKAFKQKMDYEELGAGILLGVNGGVFKCHGSSTRKAIKQGLLQAVKFSEDDVISVIKENMKEIG
ncbi:MAG: phosphate acyltransferase PlsX [Clostridia bacterium]|nr:phosphate acyltransferase PlsX [Clostridia bacterium]